MQILNFFLANLAQNFATLVGYAALGIIIVGLIVSFVNLLALPFGGKRKFHENLNHVRLRLGRFLLLALEFLIAKDIMLTIFDPRIEELFGLAVIIIIRVVLSFFLHRELKEIKLHKETA